MILILNKELLSFLFKGSLPNNENNIKEATQPNKHRNYRTTKDETLNTDEMAQKAKQVGSSVSQSSQKVETIVRDIPKIGRNEIVEIKNTNSGEINKLKTQLEQRSTPDASKRYWVMGDFLEKGEVKKQKKISKDMKKRKKLLAKYKKAVSGFNSTLKKQEDEKLYNEIQNK